MGKSKFGDGDNSRKRQDQERPQRPQRELMNRPFKAALKGVKARPPGPECLRCKGPIDSRPGFSLPFPRGSRKHQRHGYLHPDCEAEAALETAKRQGSVKTKKDGTQVPGPNVRLDVPVYDAEEIQEIISSGRVTA